MLLVESEPQAAFVVYFGCLVLLAVVYSSALLPRFLLAKFKFPVSCIFCKILTRGRTPQSQSLRLHAGRTRLLLMTETRNDSV
jgi:hypothetical protein